jgi:hypothetical protein
MDRRKRVFDSPFRVGEPAAQAGRWERAALLVVTIVGLGGLKRRPDQFTRAASQRRSAGPQDVA